MNNVTEGKPNDCYWCGDNMTIVEYPKGNRAHCQRCGTTGPQKQSEYEAITAWNSLASRLKPEPKKVTIRQWANVYEQRDGFVGLGHHKTRCEALNNSGNDCIDTVEVEITFTDSRT